MARSIRTLALALLTLTLASPGTALEWLDGRAELHGFYETQIRSIVRDFDFSDDWDLTGWAHVLDLELEADVAPDGWGPFDLISVFARVEVRYDCVWTQACSIFHSADAYRIGHTRRLPKRLIDARRPGFVQNLFIGDRRHYYGVDRELVPRQLPDVQTPPNGSRNALEFWQAPFGSAFFGNLSRGPDGIANTADDTGNLLFSTFLKDHCNQWGARSRPGSLDGRSPGQALILNPACKYEIRGELANKPNPYSTRDFNPIIGEFGRGALPFRPAPNAANTDRPPRFEAQGVYYPNYRLQQLLRDGELDRVTTSLRRSELAWNHGDAQQDQKELKEAYVDLEMFDSRLWIRAGYQTIVWGKTELFRNQDQFNPTDLALGSLTRLEESRISLWAVRGIWSFWDVGPFQDVRFELAANIDQYQPTDFGLCGEPYTPLAACVFSTGRIAHGITGVGISGATYPPDAWNSWKGVEVGGRLEWRWSRFSFAVSDYYGHLDTPHASRIFTYSRNVDPHTGRPRHTEATGGCTTGREGSCLKSMNALQQHSVNQQLFALVCASTLAVVPNLDPTACFANIFNSPNRTAPEGETRPRVVVALNAILQGDFGDGEVLSAQGRFTDATFAAIERHTSGARKVTVTLNRDVNDGPIDHPAGHPLLLEPDFQNTVAFFQATLGASISDKLTDYQEALLGCGSFYETSCDLDGIDLMNSEAGALLQSFPTVSGTQNSRGQLWDTTDRGRAQPGTLGFEGEPLCTRFENGKTFVLPGCRGPHDPGYHPSVDGTVTGLLHPFTGQQWKNELAVVSWNLLMGLVGFFPGQGEIPLRQFDPDDAFRKDGCSFAAPQWCGGVRSLINQSGVTRNSIRAGGNHRYGRRTWSWHSGGDVVLRTEKANVFGFSADFAEDVTKSNWGLEFTWWDSVPAGNNDTFDGISDVSLYRLTISVDRPTFVNFLNANRTFFFNTQWFFQYMDGYRKGINGDNPWNIFGVVAISTGYFQDRLLVGTTFVYFVMNNSFGILPRITYRFTENFSATFRIAGFAGRNRARRMPINSVTPAATRFGRNAYSSFTEPGISVIRERDEISLRVRYTF